MFYNDLQFIDEKFEKKKTLKRNEKRKICGYEMQNETLWRGPQGMVEILVFFFKQKQHPDGKDPKI